MLLFCLGQRIKKESCRKLRQDSFIFVISFFEVYTYEYCSLTTVGVVMGATTNMHLRSLFSLSFVI